MLLSYIYAYQPFLLTLGGGEKHFDNKTMADIYLVERENMQVPVMIAKGMREIQVG